MLAHGSWDRAEVDRHLQQEGFSALEACCTSSTDNYIGFSLLNIVT